MSVTLRLRSRRSRLIFSPVFAMSMTGYYKVLERIKAEGKWSRNLRSFEQLVSVSNDADPYDRIENYLAEIISDEDYQLLKKLYIEGATYREICEEYHLTKSALGCVYV